MYKCYDRKYLILYFNSVTIKIYIKPFRLDAENNLSKSSSRTHPTQQKNFISKSSPEISYTKSSTKEDSMESRVFTAKITLINNNGKWN